VLKRILTSELSFTLVQGAGLEGLCELRTHTSDGILSFAPNSSLAHLGIHETGALYGSTRMLNMLSNLLGYTGLCH
jgi:hypothetical protein